MFFAEYLVKELHLDPSLVSTRQHSLAFVAGAERLFGLGQGLSHKYRRVLEQEAKRRERIEDIIVDSIPSSPDRSLRDYIALAKAHYEQQGFTITADRENGFTMKKEGLDYWTHLDLSGLDSFSQTLSFTLFREFPKTP